LNSPTGLFQGNFSQKIGEIETPLFTDEDYQESFMDEKVAQKHKANIFYKYSNEEFI